MCAKQESMGTIPTWPAKCLVAALGKLRSGHPQQAPEKALATSAAEVVSAEPLESKLK